MFTSKITYLGELRTEAVHINSGNQIITDAPTDNLGKGEAFSPTDLVATALGSCMLTILGIKANQLEKNIIGASIHVTKIMYSEFRRIGEIEIHLQIPDDNFTGKEKQILINAAHTCPVAKSLNTSIQQKIKIEFLKKD
ncbi:MAG TPA: OsmC family protein [Chitinophagales bacterium]|nr:OsmC family protein [Chitinophagales bacterium]